MYGKPQPRTWHIVQNLQNFGLAGTTTNPWGTLANVSGTQFSQIAQNFLRTPQVIREVKVGIGGPPGDSERENRKKIFFFIFWKFIFFIFFIFSDMAGTDQNTSWGMVGVVIFYFVK